MIFFARKPRFCFAFAVVSSLLIWPSTFYGAAVSSGAPVGTKTCERIVKADIVALEQAYILNRFSAYVPAGMLYALRRDVVSQDGSTELTPGNVKLRPDKRPRPLVLRANEGDCLEVRFTNMLSPIAIEEGGIPHQNDGRLPAHVSALPGSIVPDGLVRPEKVSVDAPRTRSASFHITGLELAEIKPEECPSDVACGGDGSNVGLPNHQGLVFNPTASTPVKNSYDLGSLAKPGQTVITRWRAKTEGAYFAYSTAAPVGGEGDGGQLGLGLFAAVNIEPRGSLWYRSQVTYSEMQAVEGVAQNGHHPYSQIDYDRTRIVAGHPIPILGLLDDNNNIVHSDLNAIIVPVPGSSGSPESSACTGEADGTACNKPFREFTVIFHDEVHAEQAFSALEDESNPLHFLKDGMGINYGVSSMGSLLMTTPQMGLNTGPAKECPECRAEEFFLSSWANGDPALILKYDDEGKPVGAQYPDDPSNVHHSYLGDTVRFRNLHAGPKETHVFHLHAHQWVQDASDPNSTYLDSQTISPGATFSYNIEFGGSGNRNLTPGDSIFHCHLYPHFAQGMWELWRSHDAFVDGKSGLFRPGDPVGPDNDPSMLNLPDAEIADGTASPGLVPIPGKALAPMPTAAFRGYPFYIPGVPGHRPPQPVLDFDVDPSWTDKQTEPSPDLVVDGGLPRHVVSKGSLKVDLPKALKTGGDAAQVIAQRVAKQDPEALSTLAKEWNELSIQPLKLSGEPLERDAMKFHEGTLAGPGLNPVNVLTPPNAQWWKPARAYETDFAKRLPAQQSPTGPALFYVNSQPRAAGAPYANPCPENAPMRDYRAAFIQTELIYNKHGWFDPQGRIVILENDIKDVIDPNTRTKLPEPLFFRANSGECIDFKSSNFVPSALNVDDFQIFMPTDTIGQHIHLVKFDVTSSDGSGNGFNYEDATFSPQEVRDRIFAYNRTPNGSVPKTEAEKLKPRAHPLFLPGGDIYEAAQINPARYGALLDKGVCPAQIPGQSDEAYEEQLHDEHPFCGAQRTTQRWWADPILNRVSGKDNTLRTVFTHDHMGPSSHQQHGLYAGLVIEPANSVWTPVGQSLTAADLLTAKDSLALGCGLPDPTAVSALCAKFIGGSNLALKTNPLILNPDDPIEGKIEPRPALKLRADGGPTATMANIIAPKCIGDSDSNPLQPSEGRNRQISPSCPAEKLAHETRREFALAVADFGIAYNMALEPINPEARGDSLIRDNTLVRFGRRHVASAAARPLAISSEDPGSQYFNYRHEPLALRLSDASPDPALGGWDYRQSTTHANLDASCKPGDQYCLGDPANGFSSAVHAKRDEKLAKQPIPTIVTTATRDLLAGTPAGAKLDSVLESLERWRRDFNCALYPTTLMGATDGCPIGLSRLEPWRAFGDPATPIFPAYEGDPVQIRMIQGAQEAQHIFTMNGVRWHRLPGDTGKSVGNRGSGFTNAQPIGISEHFEFNIVANPFSMPQTDYLYFGSSVDQLWDGLWGIMRTFSLPGEDEVASPVETSASRSISLNARDFLASVPDLPPPPTRDKDKKKICGLPTAVGGKNHERYFDVSAVRVCDLFENCPPAISKGIEYSTRNGIRDEKALVYVLDGEGICADGDACDEHYDAWHATPNRAVMQKLRNQFAAGRPLEPLVLRASAGQCMHVNLRNHLPLRLNDGPRLGPDGKPQEISEAAAYHNFLPMITDGFNINQFRMSSSVGLSVPRVAQDPIWADGSNVGLNGAILTGAEEGTPTVSPFVSESGALARQGTLVPPCTGRVALDGTEEDRCKESFLWSATDFQFNGDEGNRPVEYGALPLRDFGDPLKHPAHGLIGALVIGPQGSHVCSSNRFARSGMSGADNVASSGGSSAEICDDQGKPLYVDHVLMIQDAVNATRGGMPIGNLSGAEEPDDFGVKAINYKTEPLWTRDGANDPSVGFDDRNALDGSQILSSALVTDGSGLRCAAGMPPILARKNPCDPETPILDARPGDTIRLSFVHSGGHTRQQGLAVSGHDWNPYPWSDDSHTFDAVKGSSIRQGVFNSFGPMMGITLELKAGGSDQIAMDYLIRSQASFLFDGGLWGILRVEKDKTNPVAPSGGQ